MKPNHFGCIFYKRLPHAGAGLQPVPTIKEKKHRSQTRTNSGPDLVESLLDKNLGLSRIIMKIQ